MTDFNYLFFFLNYEVSVIRESSYRLANGRFPPLLQGVALPHPQKGGASVSFFLFRTHSAYLYERIVSVLLFLFLIPFYYIVMYVCLSNLNKSEVVISSLCLVWHVGCMCMIRCLNWVTLFFSTFQRRACLFFFVLFF